ncbi:endonuclease domain-containing protein [Demequina lignilytica]|uniref:DUF559 domain-containing protein n=1 Tax=Demequina lignilytica TaxID=3051663 RepID=A0AB35MI73_9MICO|nr:hypothetical protein [Demequina sp. SYSU T0a273]MDN4483463.1 hypothetical protein [Demequina sp. SYSU T0a273]
MTTRELLAMMTRSVTPWSFAEMVAIGSKNGVASSIARGEIVRLLPDQYVAAMHAKSWAARARASLRWAGHGAALGGLSALYAWDAATDQPDHVTICMPWTARSRGPRWLRVKRFVHPQETMQFRGMRLVSPELAAITSHAELPPGSRAEAIYKPLRMGLVTPASLRQVLDGIGRIATRHELEHRIAHADAGSESYLEEEGSATVLVGPELRALLRQHVVVADGDAYRLDAFDPETLTDLEFDGFEHHGSRAAQRRDRIRDARLAALGIQTLRFTYEDVTQRPQWCRRLAIETIARRRSSGGLSVPGRPPGAGTED